MTEITWARRVTDLRARLGREPTLDELIVEARKHRMTPAEEQAQRESFARGQLPTGDPRFD